MNIKNELEKSLPSNLKLSEEEKATIRYRLLQTNTARPYLLPSFVAVMFIMVASVLIFPILPSKELEEYTLNTSIRPISEEEKIYYYEQYREIVQHANELKTGLALEVPPMETISDWTIPEDYQKMISDMVETHLTIEREKVAASSLNQRDAFTNVNGETIKGTFIYFPDILREIEVTANLDTQYSEKTQRHIFTGIDLVSSKILGSGTWEQTSYKSKLDENSQKYMLSIEGIFTIYNVSFEKAFSIEFSCDELGGIY